MSDATKKDFKVLDPDNPLLWVNQGKAMSEKEKKIAKEKMGGETKKEKAAREKEEKFDEATKAKFKHGGFTKRGPCKK